MFKNLLKSPLFLLFFIASFALVGCGDESQSAAEETADQVEETVTEEVEETTTQD